MIFKLWFTKHYQFFSIIDHFKDTISVSYDFPLDFLCSYARCDLSLSALSCCKSVFYLLEGVNGHIECEISLTKVLLLLISPQFRFISTYKIQNSLVGKPCSVFTERSSVL